MTTDEKVEALGGFATGVPRLGVPSFGSSEGIHGLVQRGKPDRGVPPTTTTQFPQPPGMGVELESRDRQEGRRRARCRRPLPHADRTPTRPMLVVWGPQADLVRDPRWGRSEEVYGEDAFFNGTMSIAFARGIQGNDPKYWQAAPLLKHFLANSNENGRMSSNSVFDERLFWECTTPCRSAMTFEDAGANAVMASYNAWNGTPLTDPPAAARHPDRPVGRAAHLERRRRGAEPLGRLSRIVPDQKAAVVASLKAGINQFLDRALDELRAAVKEGLVTEADLDEGLRRKFRLSLKLGLLDPPERVPSSKARRGRRAVGRARSTSGSPGRWRWSRSCCSRTRRRVAAAQGRAEVGRRHRPARRQRPLGLVRRHAAARDHAAAGHP